MRPRGSSKTGVRVGPNYWSRSFGQGLRVPNQHCHLFSYGSIWLELLLSLFDLFTIASNHRIEILLT